METITITLKELARSFTLIARPDTHYFLEHELPEFIKLLARKANPFRRYIRRLRSGEYIPKDSYSDKETDYVYLTIGQFSRSQVAFENLTFLDTSAGQQYEGIRLNRGDFVITRSGTVGVVHVFDAPDEKVYIPSHHLAIIELSEEDPHFREYLRLYLQSEFPRRYFWAFASGKDQKEISNWSIKSVPIPQPEDPGLVAETCKSIENEMKRLIAEHSEKEREREETLYAAILRTGKSRKEERRKMISK